MYSLWAVCFLVVFCCQSSLANISQLCGLNWVYSVETNFCYQVVPDFSVTWQGARTYCQQTGGDLVSISGVTEQNFIQAMLSSELYAGLQSSYWIGATDQAIQGEWRWTDDTPFSYLNWQKGDPSGKKADCARINIPRNYQWSNSFCTLQLSFICKQNAPSTVTPTTDITKAPSTVTPTTDITKAPSTVTPTTDIKKVPITVTPPTDIKKGPSWICNPDDSLSVSGLPPTADPVYTVNSDGLVCKTSDITNNAFTITGCPKDSYIMVSYGTYNDMASRQIHGGVEITVHNITCAEIREKNHTLDETLSASIAFASVQNVAVKYKVTSVLNTSSAIVGDDVSMTISYPENYYLELTACSANPGTAFDSNSEISLISNYCSQEKELISDFSGVNGTAIAIIQAFRFHNNNDVFIRCLVKVCPDNGGTCTTSCGSVGKRSVGEGESYETEVEKVLHVIDTSSRGATTGISLAAIILLALETIV